MKSSFSHQQGTLIQLFDSNQSDHSITYFLSFTQHVNPLLSQTCLCPIASASWFIALMSPGPAASICCGHSHEFCCLYFAEAVGNNAISLCNFYGFGNPSVCREQYTNHRSFPQPLHGKSLSVTIWKAVTNLQEALDILHRQKVRVLDNGDLRCIWGFLVLLFHPLFLSLPLPTRNH